MQKVNVHRPVPGQARPDWEILGDLAERAGRPIGLSNGEAIAKEISEVAPAYAGISWDLLDWEPGTGQWSRCPVPST